MSDYVYKIEGSFTGDQEVIAKFKKMTAAANEFEQGLKNHKTSVRAAGDEQTRQSNRRKTQQDEEQSRVQKLAKGYHTFYSAVRESGYIVREQIGALAEYVNAAKNLQVMEMRFRALNLSTEDTQRGLQAVRDTAKEVGGVRLDDLTKQLTDLHQIFGDLNEAIEFLPMAAKTQYVFGAMFGETPAKVEEDVRATMKALELMGALRATGPKGPGGTSTYLEADKQRFKDYYDMAVKMKAATGGRVSGSELLNFAKTGGVEAKLLSKEGLRDATYLIQEMGGARAGTSLMSLFMSFVAMRQGAGGPRAADAMAKLGLLDKSKVEWTGRGTPHIKRLLPGAVPLASQLGDNPLEFAASLQEAISKYGQNIVGHPVDAMKKDAQTLKDVAMIISQITGRQTGMAGLASMIIQMAQFRKDAAIVEKSKGLDELKGMVDESDVGKMKKFEAAYKNFQMQAGIPMLQLLAGLAQVAGPAFAWLGQHPSLVKFAGGLILLARSAHMTLGVLGAMRGLMASNAIISSAAAAQTGASAAAAAGNVGRLSRGMATIPAMITTTIAIAGGAAVMGYIAKLKDEADQAWADYHTVAAEGKKATQKLFAGKGVSLETLRTVTAAGAQTDLSAFMKNLARSDMFTNITTFGLADYHARAMARPELASRIQQEMPQLSNSAVMGQFMRALGTSKMDEKDRGAMIEAVREAFPTAFKQWNEALERAGGDQARAIDEMVQKEQDSARVLEEAALKMSTSLNDMSGGLDELTKKFGSIDLSKFPQREPEEQHAFGGLTKRSHIARVHENEFIMPLDKARGFLQGALGAGGPIHLSVHAPITVVGGDPAETQKAIFSGVMSAKYELERTFNILWKDRRPGA